ncbi:hypothetical protein [Anaerobaca lacustris]|uniref:Uncharacterized protein n=1 Tax=Anaerobaca lacustris TaxID=3044600 RepID=A0AAW6TWK6_9BACT|nr:hypothetical protein [Sedimentisphaerales bacterium M17dextr]
MITDLPSENDLEHAGIDYLDMAMTEAIGIALGEEYYIENNDPTGEVDLVQEYWTSVRYELAKCASLLQTGTELLLKSRIAGISPFLLLDRVSTWLNRASRENVHFDEFRTVDVRVLPQIYNTVCGRRLSDAFMSTLEGIRKRRNAIVHSASDRAVPTCESIVLDVLEVSANLIGEGKWPEIHRNKANSPPFSYVDHHDQIKAGLVIEFEFLVNLLTPSDVKRHLCISKKQRRYYCPCCKYGDVAPDIRIAQLRPNGPNSTTLYCIACDTGHTVRRQNCPHCSGNVIGKDDHCLSCGSNISQKTTIRRIR